VTKGKDTVKNKAWYNYNKIRQWELKCKI